MGWRLDNEIFMNSLLLSSFDDQVLVKVVVAALKHMDLKRGGLDTLKLPIILCWLDANWMSVVRRWLGLMCMGSDFWHGIGCCNMLHINRAIYALDISANF